MENLATLTTAVHPATRLSNVQEYYFSRKLKEVARLNAEGRDIISLAIGSPDMPPSQRTVERLCEVASQPEAHGYQPTMSTPELRQAIADFYCTLVRSRRGMRRRKCCRSLDRRRGILHVTLAFVNPGEEVLVPNPGYPTYTSLSKILGAKVVSYDLREDNAWQPDFDELESMDLSNVKLMWTNYPNMPTGGNAQRETYERLVDFALRHNIVVVNDNPYSFILNEHPMSIMQVEGARECCIEFNSMSKSHNMPGWRVGMCIANPTFTSWILKIKSNVDSGTFRGIQLAAAAALTENTQEWHREANITTYRRRRDKAERMMTTLGCTYDPQQVGMFLWGRIPDAYDGCEQLTERVLNEARVFITPGFIFGSNGNRYVRISLCAKDEKMDEALERMRRIRWTH